jgi:hypothetical protein
MDESIRTAAISPLRHRLIDDMNMRRFSRETQRNSIRDVGRFATFLGRSPDTATADDVRRFQIEQRDAGMPTPTMNSIVAGSSRKVSLARVRELLAVAPPPDDDAPEEPLDARPPCPCRGGHMIIIETFERWRQLRWCRDCIPSGQLRQELGLHKALSSQFQFWRKQAERSNALERGTAALSVHADASYG